MKQVILILVLFFSLGLNSVSCAEERVPPPTNQTVVVDLSKLPADVVAQIQRANQMQQFGKDLETAGTYAQWGHEIGIAVNETLKALTEQSSKFGDTKVGQWAMILVTFKVVATDLPDLLNNILGYIIGPIVLFVGVLTTIWSYRKNCLPQTFLIEKTPEGVKKYEVRTLHEESSLTDWAWGHAFVLLAVIILTALITFT